jgi:ParB-like chromosome segregation protein Spo0J
MIEDALNEVGAARSIVIDENNVVLAGNATIEAAASAGIERVQVVDADGETIIAVRRSGLTPEQKTRLALFDNRTSELSDFDPAVLAALQAENAALMEGLFRDDELKAILAEVDFDLGEIPGTGSLAEVEDFHVCPNCGFKYKVT